MVQSAYKLLYSFDIGQDFSVQNDNLSLNIECANNHFSFFVFDHSNNGICWFSFYQLPDRLHAESLKELINLIPFTYSHFRKISILHNNNESVLVPAEHHKSFLNQIILETVYGDLHERDIHSDDVFQWEIENIYGVEKEMSDYLKSLFPNANQIHANTIYLKSIFRQLSDMKDEWMKVYFFPSTFTVLLIKDEKLQLLQSYYYETSDDVSYYLLTIVEQFKLDVTLLCLQLSGLIEEDSILYKELRKNFLDISFENSSIQFNDENSSLPPHYFTPVLLSPLCV